MIYLLKWMWTEMTLPLHQYYHHHLQWRYQSGKQTTVLSLPDSSAAPMKGGEEEGEGEGVGSSSLLQEVRRDSRSSSGRYSSNTSHHRTHVCPESNESQTQPIILDSQSCELPSYSVLSTELIVHICASEDHWL